MNLWMNLISKVKSNWILLMVTYIMTLFCIIIANKFGVLNVWILGPLIISIFIDKWIAVLSVINFTVLFDCAISNSIESFVLNMTLGIMACLLAKHIMSLNNFTYVIVILVSSNITLSMIVNNFFPSDMQNMNTLYSSIGCLFALCGARLLYVLYAEQYIEYVMMSKILHQEYELILKLQTYSNPLFLHSQEVAKVSVMAARHVGADVKAVKAGALYHEIGRIKGDNYIEESINMVVNYGFPKKVIRIIKQHNVNYEKPSSIESTIVMLTDSILYTFDYIDKLPDKGSLSKEKIIDKIFSNRLSKGVLINSGLSHQKYNNLKQFYMDYYI